MSSAGDPPAVGTEREALVSLRLPANLPHFIPALRVPEANRVVPVAGGDSLSVGTERHTACPVPGDRTDRLPRRGIPDADRPIAAAADDPLAVGAERHTADVMRVS